MKLFLVPLAIAAISAKNILTNTVTPLGTCGKDVKCRSAPYNCNFYQKASACVIISWDPNSDPAQTTFNIQSNFPNAGNIGWSAFAISNNPLGMHDGDTYMCYQDGTSKTSQFSTNWISGYGAPAVSDEIEQIRVDSLTNNMNNGAAVSCTFTRPNCPQDGEYAYSNYCLDSGNFFMMIANGPMQFDYHDQNDGYVKEISENSFNWLK